MQACTYANRRLSQWLLRTQTNSLSVDLPSIYRARNSRCFFRTSFSHRHFLRVFVLVQGITVWQTSTREAKSRRGHIEGKSNDSIVGLSAGGRRRSPRCLDKLFEVEVRSTLLDRIAMKRSIRSALRTMGARDGLTYLNERASRSFNSGTHLFRSLCVCRAMTVSKRVVDAFYPT